MNKIRRYIIHLLGGVDGAELKAIRTYESVMATYLAYGIVKLSMEKVNGLAADDWCKQMYNYVCGEVEKMEAKLYEIE